MKDILVIGAGKIGSLIATLLAEAGDYRVTLADITLSQFEKSTRGDIPPHLSTLILDISNKEAVSQFLQTTPYQAVISCLPFYRNSEVAELAKQYGMHYFDLTEDIDVTRQVTAFAQGAKEAYVPQCGLAPGFVNIVAHTFMKACDEIDTVKLRVGALPQQADNALRYALTWSVEGLINQYCNPCQAIVNRALVTLPSLTELEQMDIEGDTYEAFLTSGGLGSLGENYAGKVNMLNYKTLRYPGHCEKMNFLLHDLKLVERRDLLKEVLQQALPTTEEDMVIVNVSVTGKKKGQAIQETYTKKFYPKRIGKKQWTAIQVTTASGVCSVFDIVMSHPEKYHGKISHEQFSLDEILQNRFGKYYE